MVKLSEAYKYIQKQTDLQNGKKRTSFICGFCGDSFIVISLAKYHVRNVHIYNRGEHTQLKFYFEPLNVIQLAHLERNTTKHYQTKPSEHSIFREKNYDLLKEVKNACDILKIHHDAMKDDPEHLTTEFIKKLIKVNCKEV